MFLPQGQANAALTNYIFEQAGNVEVQAVGSPILPNSSRTNSCGVTPGGLLKSSSAVICTGPDGDYNEYILQESYTANDTIQVVLGTPPPVPGPLPLLGAGAAFGWSRRLRNRIAASLRIQPKA